MTYKQGFFGGDSQQIKTFDNIDRTYKQTFFGEAAGSQSIKLFDQPRIPPEPVGAAIKTVGKTQISTDDGATWVNTFPAAYLKVDTDVDFLVRTDPAALDEPDDGTYEYDFRMATVGAGGLNLINDSVDKNKARITGKTPPDQVGIVFSVNCTIVDVHGTSKTGNATTQTWTA